MLAAALSAIQGSFTDAQVHVFVGSVVGRRRAIDLGMIPIDFDSRGPIESNVLRARSVSPSFMIALGADVLDGSYDARFSLRMLATVDLIARAGAETVITGFSVSRNPSRETGPAFDALSESIKVFARDPVSMRRLMKLTGRRIELSADIAFLLEQKSEQSLSRPAGDAFRWISRQRKNERIVLAVNLHPLLLNEDVVALDQLINKIATSLKHLMLERSVSVLLVNHDFRDAASDSHCLEEMHRILGTEGHEAVYYLSEECDARDLKFLISQVDGVVSGRMHLSIAALGVGTPILALNYKGKSEGLLEHFKMPSRCLVEATDCLIMDDLGDRLTQFVLDLEGLETQINLQLPAVKLLASRNLASLSG